MDVAEIAKKVDALKAELAAKSSRIAVLEARVSLLEAENARLRKAMPEGVATDRRGTRGPTFGQLEDGLGRNKQKSADIAGGHVMNGVIEISDGEEEGMAVDCSYGERAEEDVPAVPTPRNSAVRVVTGKSGAEDEIKDAGGGGERDHGGVCCDGNVILEDDDVLITPRGKKRAAARVISDSESEDGDGHGDENDRGHGKGEVGVTRSRKRALLEVSDSESEDGSEGVRVVSQKPVSRVVTTGIESEDDDDELYEMDGSSTPATRRSTRSAKSQSKIMRPPRRQLEFVDPKDHEESEDVSEDGDSMDEFIVDSDCSENSAEEFSAEPEESDNEESYKDLMDRIRGKRDTKNKDWKIEPEMLSAFGEHPELCLKAVCALYRKQTEDEQACKATIMHNKKGFNQIDARRGSHIAQFLLDGDASGPLKKTTQDLEKYDRYALEFCHKMALRYSKQLFAIYQNKEDAYFP